MRKFLLALTLFVLVGCDRSERVDSLSDGADQAGGDVAAGAEVASANYAPGQAPEPSATGKVPVIKGTPLLEVVYGERFEYEITAENDPMGFAVTNQPPWLHREGRSLSGHPSQLGEFNLELRAFNQYGSSDSFHLKIIVKPRP